MQEKVERQKHELESQKHELERLKQRIIQLESEKNKKRLRGNSCKPLENLSRWTKSRRINEAAGLLDDHGFTKGDREHVAVAMLSDRQKLVLLAADEEESDDESNHDEFEDGNIVREDIGDHISPPREAPM